ncbi:InlB B-repeat-containing protein, partial [Mesobacillus zeae]|uniref:InlB B-repeat-containing protein n=1 Tax=Mesobacillus zeae TaxID=1917180 RepID=UPI00300AC48E
AKWEPNEYTIHFDSQGGSNIADYFGKYGMPIAKPENPIKAGYTFIGWNKDLLLTSLWDFAFDTVASDQTLYADWKINRYSVTFNSQGGTQVAGQTINFNSTVSTPAAPKKTGYTFGGWYKEASCIHQWDFSKETVKENTTLYAKWIPNPAKPSSPKATSVSYNSIKISWIGVSGANGYEVDRATSSTGTYSYVGTTSSTSYTNTGLTTNKTYYYKVRTYRLVGSSKVYGNYSGVVSAKPVPSIPANLKAARYSSSSIKLTWSKVSGATGYQVYRATSKTGTYSYVKGTTSSSYINTGLTKKKTYYYKIRAYRTVGKTKVYSGWTTIVSAMPY